MTQEDKELLLKDLCSRMPYEVVISRGQYDKNPIKINSISVTSIGTFFNGYFTEGIHFTFDGKGGIWPKPYLRPMSSMTDEEYDQLYIDSRVKEDSDDILDALANDMDAIDWLNAHHFDYRGLIEKGLALEAPEGIYK